MGRDCLGSHVGDGILSTKKISSIRGTRQNLSSGEARDSFQTGDTACLQWDLPLVAGSSGSIVVFERRRRSGLTR